MDVLLGHSPLALGLAAHLAARGPAVVASAEPPGGATTWRWADPLTGEGLAAALRPARRLFVVAAPGDALDGVVDALRPHRGLPTVVIAPLSAPEPAVDALLRASPGASLVRVGPAWGPADPLIAAWAQTLREGGMLWVPDSPPIRARSVTDVAAAAVAATERPRARWTLGTPDGHTLPELAAHLAVALGRPHRSLRVPMRAAAWRAGVDPAHVLRWREVPAAAPDTPGWTPPRAAGPATWIGVPSRWRNGG